MIHNIVNDNEQGREQYEQEQVDDIVRQVLEENPVEDVGIRNEWYEHVGWHRKEDIRLHDTAKVAKVVDTPPGANNKKGRKRSRRSVDTDHSIIYNSNNNNLRGRIGSVNPKRTIPTKNNRYIMNPNHDVVDHRDNNNNNNIYYINSNMKGSIATTNKSIFSDITPTTNIFTFTTATTTVWLLGTMIIIILLLLMICMIICILQQYRNRIAQQKHKLRLL